MSTLGLTLVYGMLLDNSCLHLTCWIFDESRSSQNTLPFFSDSIIILKGNVSCNNSTKSSSSLIIPRLLLVAQLEAVLLGILQELNNFSFLIF